MYRHLLQDLLGREDLVTHLDETNHVPGDASGQRDQVLRRPRLQWRVPRQPDQRCIWLGS